MASNKLIARAVILCIAIHLSPPVAEALPAFISRMSESIMGTSSATPLTSSASNVSSSVPTQRDGQQPQQPTPSASIDVAQANKMINSLQAQLEQLKAQKAMQNGPSSGGLNNQANKFHMLDVLQNMGKAIQQQLLSSGQNIQIITSPAAPNANNKKNEYQQLSSATSNIDEQQKQQSASSGLSYREQGEVLRQEIVRRAGQLQSVLATSMDIMKDKSDMIVRRLLESLNSRIDQAKSKADRIINEPATNEMAVKTLNTINQGLNQLNNIITNIVSRFDMTNNKDATQKISAGLAAFQASANPMLQFNGQTADRIRAALTSSTNSVGSSGSQTGSGNVAVAPKQ